MEGNKNSEEQDSKKLKTEHLLSPCSNEPKLSKKQRKKLARKEKWDQMKTIKRAEEKEKRRLKLQEAIKSGKSLGPSRKMLKANKMKDSSCQIKVVFDLSLDILMTEAEKSKTFKQLHRCYSINRRAAAPLQVYICGYSDHTKETLNKLNFMNWDAHIKGDKYFDVFSKDTITYLTSDSPNTLKALDENTAYIIGALVDHNRLKNICYEKALENKVGHAKLPLDDYIEMKSRNVLTIDQVFLILLRITEGMTWEEAFLNVIPQRKGAVSKQSVIIENK